MKAGSRGALPRPGRVAVALALSLGALGACVGAATAQEGSRPRAAAMVVPATAPASPTAAAAASAPAFAERSLTPALLTRLRTGGLVLYLRHGLTDNRVADRQPAVDLADCDTQRPLSPEGRQQFVRVGEALRRLAIPVAEVLSSPMCRALDSARAAFGDVVRIDRDLMASSNQTAAQKRPILARTRQLLSDPVAAGGHRVIVAHAPNLADLIGYYPAEATMAVFEPLGRGDFRYLASVPVGQWARLVP